VQIILQIGELWFVLQKIRLLLRVMSKMWIPKCYFNEIRELSRHKPSEIELSLSISRSKIRASHFLAATTRIDVVLKVTRTPFLFSPNFTFLH